MSAQPAPEPPVGALAPFQSRAFLWLWIGVVLSSVGSWAQTVGAQWLFINDPNAATIVSLVQTAATLPMVLFALAAGVLADAFDRRRLILTCRCLAFCSRGPTTRPV